MVAATNLVLVAMGLCTARARVIAAASHCVCEPAPALAMYTLPGMPSSPLLPARVECADESPAGLRQDTLASHETTAHSHDSDPWPSRAFKTEPFILPNLTITKSGDTAPGLLFLGFRGEGSPSQAPVILTEDGELVWHAGSGTSTNFKVQQINGSDHLTYWQGRSSFTFGHGYGAIHVLNSSYTEVSRLCPQGLDLHTTTGKNLECWLDMHESHATDRGTVVSTAYNVTQADLRAIGGPEHGWVYDSLFFEIDLATQEVVLSWSALDHLDQIPLNGTRALLSHAGVEYGRTRSRPIDLFHINSVQPLPDGFLVNSRHTRSVYKVGRDGRVEWRLGGAPGDGDFARAGDDDWEFSWQHHARLEAVNGTDLRLHLFSNSNSELQDEEMDSLGLELALDVDKKQVRRVASYGDPKDPRHAYAMGSYQPLPHGHVLLGYGKDPTVKEFDSHGACVYTASFGDAAAPQVVASYRAFKHAWRAVPAWAPKAVAEYSPAENTTTVYASWNGATPDAFDGWAVTSADSGEDLDTLALLDAQVHARTGFETAVVLAGRHVVVQAVARQGSAVVRASAAAVVVDLAA